MTLFLWPTLLGNHGDYDHHGWWPLWPVLWVAVLATIVWLVARRRSAPPHDGNDRAREILAERLARGEIGGDEYRERLEHLR
jgi:putative membrane protein